MAEDKTMSEHARFRPFCILLLVTSKALALPSVKIDNHLAIIADDCYSRFSIGFKPFDKDVSLEIKVASLAECEEKCSGRRTSCVAIAFGIGIRGNATCLLAGRRLRFDELRPDPDYDVYLRTRRLPQCERDRARLLTFGTGYGQNEGPSNGFGTFDASEFSSLLPKLAGPYFGEYSIGYGYYGQSPVSSTHQKSERDRAGLGIARYRSKEAADLPSTKLRDGFEFSMATERNRLSFDGLASNSEGRVESWSRGPEDLALMPKAHLLLSHQ